MRRFTQPKDLMQQLVTGKDMSNRGTIHRVPSPYSYVPCKGLLPLIQLEIRKSLFLPNLLQCLHSMIEKSDFALGCELGARTVGFNCPDAFDKASLNDLKANGNGVLQGMVLHLNIEY